MSKLSMEMQDALGRAKANGGELVRWEGGWWTHPGAVCVRVSGNFRVPTWSCSWGTVRALVERGLLVIAEHRATRGGNFAIRARLSDCAPAASPTDSTPSQPVAGTKKRRAR